jgi:nickel superoxide dismutase
MWHKSLAAVALIMILGTASTAWSHCQIPCGIYDDETRFTMLAEHITTIEKSMNEIIRLSVAAEKDFNQIVRWVNNKDTHADEFSDIITYYFMAQRITPVEDGPTDAFRDYQRKIIPLHGLLVYAMKAKQTADLAHVEKLRSLLADFRTAYFGPQDEQKLGE